ncbi:thioesterase II family protein [Streptomyces tritici]|uniref:thioesterase II family protein n=1 Tax=Streptomyces tritici TaxID=2054410 RepID=UPI003AF013EA
MIPTPVRARNAASQDGRWLRRLRPLPAPRIRLVCLPHAGGTAGAFRDWAEALPDDVELVAVQYPGRQDRFAEPCVPAMGPLADSVAQVLLPLFDRPVALLGHSMGAALAYEVTLRLEALYRARPRWLFVSGHGSPLSPRSGRDLHLRDDEAMVQGLLELGGMDPGLVAEPELLALLLPSFRADLTLIETYRPAGSRPVTVPLTAYVGDADPGVPVAHAAAWSDLTSAEFSLRVFPGDHFSLVQGPEIVTDVAGVLAGAH